MRQVTHPDYPNHYFELRSLDRHVLAVASVHTGPNDWAAYIGAVIGKNHDDEWELVYRQGSKLSKEIAEMLFPDLAASALLRWRK